MFNNEVLLGTCWFHYSVQGDTVKALFSKIFCLAVALSSTIVVNT